MTPQKQSEADAASLRKIDRVLVDLRRGIPVIIENSSEGGLLVQAAELATENTLKDFKGLAGSDDEIFVLITPKRAETLKIRLYTEGAIAVPLGSERPLSEIEHLADPAKDLDHAMLGPFAARREPLGDSAAAALEALKLAGLLPAALARTCEAHQTSLRETANRLGLLAIAATELMAARSLAAKQLKADEPGPAHLSQVTSAKVPLADAQDTRLVAFRPEGLFGGGPEHIAIVIGNPDPRSSVLIRLHSECFTGDLLSSLKCDCGDQLRGAIEEMQAQGGGIVLYLAQEGRGIGLMNKLRAYHLQDLGFDTVDANLRLGFEADERLFECAAVMLEKLGVSKVRLMTNNPDKVDQLKSFGIDIVERVAHTFPSNQHNEAYLETKKERSGHLL